MTTMLAILYVLSVASALAAPPLDITPATPSSLLPQLAGHLLVVGNSSDNIVRFNLATGESTVVAKLATGSGPWSIAVNEAGEIYVGLHGNKRNIVRLVSGQRGGTTAPLVAVDLTGRIGRFGPGLMAFDRRGILNVAGDTIRAVLRYDVETGQLVESMRLRAANLMGLTLADDTVYVAEYFQKTILRFDLSADPAAGKKFIYKSSRLDRAHGMTIGHNGNLFVSNLKNSFIQEFDSTSGKFVKTFLDVHTIGGGSVKDLHYEPQMDRYFLTSGSAVYVLSTDGALLAKHESIAMSGAVGIAMAVPR
jgi:DNA-binding beta-propeller fold protein YncE